MSEYVSVCCCFFFWGGGLNVGVDPTLGTLAERQLCYTTLILYVTVYTLHYVQRIVQCAMLSLSIDLSPCTL